MSRLLQSLATLSVDSAHRREPELGDRCPAGRTRISSALHRPPAVFTRVLVLLWRELADAPIHVLAMMK